MNKVMKPTADATARAKIIETRAIRELNIKREFDYCLRHRVCPQCAGKVKRKLEETGPEGYSALYKCENTVGGQNTTCGFIYKEDITRDD